MTKKPKLTLKQTKFVKAKAEGKTGVEAAMIAYDTDSYTTANAIAVENLQKPSIQQAVNDAMEKAGITPYLAIAPIGEALKHDDLDMRLKGSDRALKLMLPKEQSASVNINFNQVAKADQDEFSL